MNLEFEKQKGWTTKEEVKTTREKSLLLAEKSRNEVEIKSLKEKSKGVYTFTKESVALTETINKLLDRNEEIEKLLTTTSVGTDESITDYSFGESEIEFSVGNMNGRNNIDIHNRRRIPGAMYNNTGVAQIVTEGEEAETKRLNESLTVNVTEKEEVIIFEDIQGVNISSYSDDKENYEKAFSHVHNELIVNAENKKAFEIIQASKEALSMTVDTILEVINSNLCAKAKKRATIVVNKNGFKKLDIDVNGVPVVTKNENGDFVFKKKYLIQEVPNEILPDNENGESVVIIGDLGIVRFFLVNETNLEKDDFNSYMMLDRQIRKEIITLSTHSDEAYIHGTIS